MAQDRTRPVFWRGRSGGACAGSRAAPQEVSRHSAGRSAAHAADGGQDALLGEVGPRLGRLLLGRRRLWLLGEALLVVGHCPSKGCSEKVRPSPTDRGWPRRWGSGGLATQVPFRFRGLTGCRRHQSPLPVTGRGRLCSHGASASSHSGTSESNAREHSWARPDPARRPRTSSTSSTDAVRLRVDVRRRAPGARAPTPLHHDPTAPEARTRARARPCTRQAGTVTALALRAAAGRPASRARKKAVTGDSELWATDISNAPTGPAFEDDRARSGRSHELQRVSANWAQFRPVGR